MLNFDCFASGNQYDNRCHKEINHWVFIYLKFWLSTKTRSLINLMKWRICWNLLFGRSFYKSLFSVFSFFILASLHIMHLFYLGPAQQWNKNFAKYLHMKHGMRYELSAASSAYFINTRIFLSFLFYRTIFHCHSTDLHRKVRMVRMAPHPVSSKVNKLLKVNRRKSFSEPRQLPVWRWVKFFRTDMHSC